MHANERVTGMSGPCGHCALCGNHGKHNKSMGPRVSQIMGKNKTFHSTKNWHAQTMVFM